MPVVNTQVDPTTGLQPSPSRGTGTVVGFDVPTPDPDIQKIDISKYERYVPKGDVFVNVGLESARAAGQGGIEQFGAMLNQAIVGEIIGGTMEGVGYLLDAKQYGDLIRGTEQEFGNWFSDLGKGLRTWTQDVTPIYTDYEPGSWSPGNWSWWMSNMPSIASTLSLMIPSAAAVRGVSALARAANLSAKVGKATKWMGRGITQAVVSRHMENLMEASQTAEEIKEAAIAAGQSPEEAKKLAAIAAADSYNRNWVMVAQDIPQYLLLGRAFGKASRPATAAVGKRMGYNLAPVVGRKIAAVGWDMIGEFGEEAYQYVTAEESKHLVYRTLNPELDSSFDERMQSYLRDGELWTAATFGALGAGAMQTAGRALNDAIAGKGNTENARRVANINAFAPQIKYWAEEIRRAEDMGDVAAKAEAEVGLGAVMGSRAAAVGGLAETIDMVETMYKEGGPTAEDLERFGLDEEDASTIKEKFPNLVEQLKRVGELYDYHNKNFDSDLAAAMAQGEFRREELYKNSEILKSQIEEQASKIVYYDSLSLMGKQILDFNTEIKAYSKRVAALKRRLQNDPNLKDNPEGRKQVEEQLASSERALEELISKRDQAVKERSAEDRANDQKFESEMTPETQESVGRLYDLKSKLSYSELALMSLEQQMEQLRQAQKERAKKPKKEAAPVEPEVEPEEPAEPRTAEERAKEATRRKKEREEEIRQTAGEEDTRPERLLDMASKDYTINQLLHSGGAKYTGFLNNEPGIFYFEGGQFKFKEDKTGEERILEKDHLSGKTLGSIGAVLAKHSLFDTELGITNGVITLSMAGLEYEVLPLDRPLDAIKVEDGLPVSITVYRKGTKVQLTFTSPPFVHEMAYGIALLEEAKERVLTDYFKLDDNKGVRVRDPESEAEKEYEVYNKKGKWVVVNPESGRTIRRDSKVAKRVLKVFNEDIYFAIETDIAGIGQNISKEEKRNEIYRGVVYLRPPTPEQTNKSADVSTVQDPKGETGEEVTETPESIERGEKAEGRIVDTFAKDRASEEIDEEMAKEDAERQPDTIQGTSTTVEPLADTEIPSEHKADQGEYAGTIGDVDHIGPGNNIVYSRPDSVVAVYNPAFVPELDKLLSDPATDIKSITAEITIVEQNKNGKWIAVEVDKKMSDKEIGNLDMQVTVRHKGKVISDNVFLPLLDGKLNIKDPTDRSYLLDHRKRVVSDSLAGKKTIVTISRSPGKPNNTGVSKNILQLLTEAGKELSDVDFAYGDLNKVPHSLHGLHHEVAHRNALTVGPGNVVMIHNMTPDQGVVASKVNPRKLGTKHATILWQAFKNAATTEGAFGAVYKGEGVSGNVTNGEVISFLTFAGAITKERIQEGAIWLADKVLAFKFNKGNPFIEYNFDLDTWDTTKLYIKTATEEQINDFINFAAEHKNFSIDFDVLGALVPNSFTIGDIKFNKGQSFLHEALANDIVTTDLELYSGKSAYRSPLLILNFEGPQPIAPTPAEPDERELAFAEDGAIPEPISAEEARAAEEATAEAEKIKVGDIVVMRPLDPVTEGVIKTDIRPFIVDEIKEYERDILSALESGDADIAAAEEAYYGIPGPGEEGYVPSMVADLTPVKLEGGKWVVDVDEGRDPLFGAPMGRLMKTSIRNEEIKLGIEPKEKPGETLDDILNKDIPFSHRTGVRNVQEKIDLNKDLAWLRDKLGAVDLLRFNEVVSMAVQKGREVMGFVYKGAIGIFEDAKPGTIQHEGFELVFKHYLTPKQQQRVLKEAKERYAPELLAHYVKDSLDDLTDKQVAHFIADRFMEFVESEGEVKPDGPQMRNWFQKILDFIRALVQFNKSEIEKLFDAIQRGDFRNRAETFTNDQKEIIVQNLAYRLMTENNIDKFENIEELDYTLVKKYLNDRLEGLRKAQEIKANVDKALEIAKLASVHERILMEWNEFVELTNDYLGQLNIKRKEGELVGDTEENERNEFEMYDKAPYEISAKDNVLTEIKLLISSLPRGEVVDGEKRGHLDDLTGMYRFVDFGTMWSDLIHEMHDALTDTEMIRRLETRARRSLPHHVLLYGGPGRVGLMNGPDSLRVKFFTTMRKHRNDFVDFRYNVIGDEIVSAGIRSSFVRTQATKYLQQWGQEFFLSSFFNQTTKQPNRNLASKTVGRFGKFIQEVRNAYTGEQFTREQFNDFYRQILGFYRDLSIPMDSGTLTQLLSRSLNEQQALHNFVVYDMSKVFGVGGLLHNIATGKKIVNAAKDVVQPRDYFKNESNIRKVARAHAEDNPHYAESAILGPGGNTFFVYSPPSPLTDLISKLAQSSEQLAKLANVTYNKNSQYIRQIQGGAKINVQTLSSFVQEASGEISRDYLEISPLEDFVLKVSAVQSNSIPLPTLAERKMMYLWSGLERVQMIDAIVEDGEIVIPEEVISIFEGYKSDETARIREAKKAVDDAIESGNYKKLVENYHYQTDDNGKPIYKTKDGKYTGNAMRYTHFNSSKSVEEIIDDRIKDTIKMAGELDVITVSEGRVVSNNYLPEIYIKKFRKKFGSDRLAVEALLAEYTVNTMMSAIETEKLLAGDGAYYKLANDEVHDDRVKRLAILAASGDKLASNMVNPQDPSLARNAYKVITLNTQKYRSEEIYDELVKKQTPVYQKLGMTEEAARALAKSKLGALLEVDPTDAQVYISPEMYRQVSMRLGEWNSDKQEAFDLLQSEEELSPADEIKAMSIVMQPLKLVYFEQHFEGTLGIPVLDKMSLATIFKKVAAGTQLEPLYNRMVDSNNPIDAIKFDSAVKAGARQQVNYFTDDTRDNVDVDVLASAPVYEQFFSGLYRQVVTDPHEVMRQLLGTQMKKVALSNIQPTGKYRMGGSKLVVLR